MDATTIAELPPTATPAQRLADAIERMIIFRVDLAVGDRVDQARATRALPTVREQLVRSIRETIACQD